MPAPTGTTRVANVAAVANRGDILVAVGSTNEVSQEGAVDLADASVVRPLRDEAVPAVSRLGSAHPGRQLRRSRVGGRRGHDLDRRTTWTRVPDTRALHGQPMPSVAVRGACSLGAGGAEL